MSRIRPYLLAVLMICAAVLGVNGVAVATTGHSLILGHGNSADAATGLTRTTDGPALRLNVKSGASAPFTVNSEKKVTHLNADLVDGKSASALQNRAYRYSVPTIAATHYQQITLPGLPPGRYLASYAISASMDTAGRAMDCGFHNMTTGGYELVDYAVNNGSYATIAATGILDTRQDTYTFDCFDNGGTFTYYNSQPNYSQLSFVELDSVTDQAAALPSAAAAGGLHGTAK